MFRLILLTLCFFIFGNSTARVSQVTSRMAEIGGDSEDMPLSTENNLKDELNQGKENFLNSNFDFEKYISKYPSNMASIENAKKSLDAGDIEIFMPPEVDVPECHVEFQVIERVPGRCTRLAGRIPACQAEKYIGMNYNECS